MITRLENEVRVANADLSARMSILEHNVAKSATDNEDRFLQIENGMAQQNACRKKKIETLTQYNDILTSNVDDLMQEKLASNIYITELPAHSHT